MSTSPGRSRISSSTMPPVKEKERWIVHPPEGSGGPLSGVLVVLWHGAGGDVSEASLVALARRFATSGATAVRARFAYRRAGRRFPDPMPALLDDTRETIALLRREVAPEARALVLGGRSMGGRVTSMLAAADPAGAPPLGLVFLGYPLHPAGAPEKLRDAHLPAVPCPMLFLQGDRDELCDLDLLRPVLERLGAKATLELYPGADHSLRKVAPEVLAARATAWVTGLLLSPAGRPSPGDRSGAR